MSLAPKYPVPVFPLPGVVAFPHVVLPLHIFELRYRTMVRDALSGERLIAMATLTPGWEHDYHGSPAFAPIGCLARISAIEWLPNDHYDLSLVGLVRVRFVRQAREFPYRACEVELLPPTPFDAGDPLAQMERHSLLSAMRRLLPAGEAAWFAPPVVAPDAPLEAVVNTVAQCIRLDAAFKLELLHEDSVFERCRRLVSALSAIPMPPPSAEPPPSGDPEGGRWN